MQQQCRNCEHYNRPIAGTGCLPCLESPFPRLPHFSPRRQPLKEQTIAFIPNEHYPTDSIETSEHEARTPPSIAAQPHNLTVVRPKPAGSRVIPDVGPVREQYPLFDGLFAYFPAALCEVARWSLAGNAKHNPGQPLHWSREKSTDHENKILRHLLDARLVNDEGFVEAVGMAWRALALCQTILEERGWAEGANSRRLPEGT